MQSFLTFADGYKTETEKDPNIKTKSSYQDLNYATSTTGSLPNIDNIDSIIEDEMKNGDKIACKMVIEVGMHQLLFLKNITVWQHWTIGNKGQMNSNYSAMMKLEVWVQVIFYLQLWVMIAKQFIQQMYLTWQVIQVLIQNNMKVVTMISILIIFTQKKLCLHLQQKIPLVPCQLHVLWNNLKKMKILKRLKV